MWPEGHRLAASTVRSQRSQSGQLFSLDPLVCVSIYTPSHSVPINLLQSLPLPTMDTVRIFGGFFFKTREARGQGGSLLNEGHHLMRALVHIIMGLSDKNLDLS